MNFASVFPPMPTPFTDGEVDTPAITFNLERWMRAGLGGVVAPGTNGEAVLLDDTESDRGRMVTTGFGVPGLKAALDPAGYKGGDPRAPLAPAPSEANDQIRAELARVAEAV